MSAGTAQIVAVGAQDVHLVGNPEVSFFKSSYKRHTNFAQSVEKQVLQGVVKNEGMSSIRFERKGDLLSYVYLAPVNAAGDQHADISDWSTVIDKIELLVGGQVVDTQDAYFTERIAPDVLASTHSKAKGVHFGRGKSSAFYPLRFFHCENYHACIPLVALQYHDVEMRIKWGSGAESYRWEAFSNYIYLDNDERNMVASKPHDILCFQVQSVLGSGNKIQELVFNHPVKLIASCPNVSGSDGSVNVLTAGNKVKLQVNGVDISDFKFAHPNYSTVPSYYHVQDKLSTDEELFLYSFCLDTAKTQPTGSLNFSRIDSARLLSSDQTFNEKIYAINYNILHIEKGMGGLMYAN
jgi:hypothetical protein